MVNFCTTCVSLTAFGTATSQPAIMPRPLPLAQPLCVKPGTTTTGAGSYCGADAFNGLGCVCSGVARYCNENNGYLCQAQCPSFGPCGSGCTCPSGGVAARLVLLHACSWAARDAPTPRALSICELPA